MNSFEVAMAPENLGLENIKCELAFLQALWDVVDIEGSNPRVWVDERMSELEAYQRSCM
jgi:hypothetical protein